jgi:hypothetical protein
VVTGVGATVTGGVYAVVGGEGGMVVAGTVTAAGRAAALGDDVVGTCVAGRAVDAATA